jgi:5-methylcytosine-specific restriction endonuclease McrA
VAMKGLLSSYCESSFGRDCRFYGIDGNGKNWQNCQEIRDGCNKSKGNQLYDNHG